MSLGVNAGVAAAVSYHSLTGGSYISKSDRPYAHSPGAVAASTRHSAGQQALDDDHHLHMRYVFGYVPPVVSCSPSLYGCGEHDQ